MNNAMESSRESYRIRLIAGTANPSLAKSIARELKLDLENAEIGKFADGEVKIQLNDNVRGGDAFIIQPMSPPNGNDNFMELLLLINTLRLSSAKRITVVIPYFGYARQDQKTKSRVPISASAVARLISSMQPNRVLTVDLHCGQIQGFFPPSIPVDHLFAETEMIVILSKFILNTGSSNVVIVSPDAGGVTRANRIAEKLGANGVVTILKRRVEANKVESMEMVGNVRDSLCIIVDDMIDTGGTLCKAARLLKENGAVIIVATATHGIFSSNALQKINESCLDRVYVTDTISQYEKECLCDKLHVISLAPLLAKAIQRVHNEQSLSDLFFTFK